MLCVGAGDTAWGQARNVEALGQPHRWRCEQRRRVTPEDRGGLPSLTDKL